MGTACWEFFQIPRIASHLFLHPQLEMCVRVFPPFAEPGLNQTKKMWHSDPLLIPSLSSSECLYKHKTLQRGEAFHWYPKGRHGAKKDSAVVEKETPFQQNASEKESALLLFG